VERSEIKLMGAAEIGARLRISRQRTYILVNRREFPAPIASLAMGQVWLASDVEAWIRENRPHLDEEDLP
jgi:prophage regulatory protein